MENHPVILNTKGENVGNCNTPNKDMEAALSADDGCVSLPGHSPQDFELEEATYEFTSQTENSSKFQWNEASTLLLVEEYRKNYENFRNPKIKKKSLWDTISKYMQQRGYAVDSDMLDKKMRNMKKTYRKIVDNNNKKKTTGKGKITWTYFEIFQDIFHDDRAVNLPSAIICSTNKDNGNCVSSSKLVSAPVPLLSPFSPLLKETGIPPAGSTHYGTPSTSKPSKMEKYRKRQLELEEEKLDELKKLRLAIEASNEIQKEKLILLKQLAVTRQP